MNVPGRRTLSPWVCLAWLVAVPACTPCHREGCDALASAVPDSSETAIAGVIAAESDTVGNGCQECVFSTATLALWKTETPVADAQTARTIVNGSQPTLTVNADGRYRQVLNPGHYLVRLTYTAAAFEVVAGHVTTLHLRLINGPAQFTVFDPVTRLRHQLDGFEVGL